MYSCKRLILTIPLVCVVKSVIFCGLQNEYYLEPGTTHNCARCSSCSPGQFIKTKCTVSNDTLCEECPPGTFSVERDSIRCTECTSCSDNRQFTIQTCTAMSNTICAPCPEHMVLRDGICNNCSTCPPGTYALRKCSGENDTVCSVCRPGSFTATKNQDRYCKACTICLKNRIYNRLCTSKTDNICGDCKPGHYANENTGNCEKCSYCYPDHPGYTAHVPACAHISMDLNYTCMPVRQPPPLEFAGTPDVETTSSVAGSSTVTIMPQTKSQKLSARLCKVIIAVTSILIFIMICAVVVYCKLKRKNGHTTRKLLNVIKGKPRRDSGSHTSKEILLEENGMLGSSEGCAENENVSSNEALGAVFKSAESATINLNETIGGSSDETIGGSSDETVGFEKFDLPEHVVSETHPYIVDELQIDNHSENDDRNIPPCSVDKVDGLPGINEKPRGKVQKEDHQLIVNRTHEMTVPMFMRGMQI